ncbi:unnamed protein product [Meganyctiphanes norvegica]|uniref:C2H2-type domain-containing protein n=1 Tax=Meganyctiphanes norvegica TaxID=48144 RepID=A0AAV2RPK8_MEGNR
MSGSALKEECAANFAQDSRLHNIANVNEDAEVKHDNQYKVKSDDSHYPQEVLLKSSYDFFEENIKEEIEVKYESIDNQAVEIKHKNEIEIYAEPIKFTEDSYLEKQELSFARGNSYQCEKISSKNINLIYLQNNHSVEKSYQCSQSDNASSLNTIIIKHLRADTGEKPYQCRQCDKTFSRNHNFIIHQRTHTGKKPYQCSQCDGAFSSKDALVVHQITHTGEKPYQCNQCVRTFSNKRYLTKHQITHIQEKPYQCSQCEKVLSHKNSSYNASQNTHWRETI